VDIDPAATRCARRNLAADPAADRAGDLAGAARVYTGDLYRPLPGELRGRVDVLVANAPYVPTGAIELMPPEARDHEPRVALDGGPDGLDVLRRVAAPAADWLAPGGRLLVETGEWQAPVFGETLARAGLVPRVVSDEALGATVVIGTRP